jgi:hypothetical protein
MCHLVDHAKNEILLKQLVRRKIKAVPDLFDTQLLFAGRSGMAIWE